MAYYPQRNKRPLSIGEDGNALVMLIAVLMMVFVIFTFIKIIYFFTYGGQPGASVYERNVLPWVTLPSTLSVFLTRPWTLITHMFMHAGVWHLVGNLIWLWTFGYILQDLAGNRKIIPIFLYGGLAGGIVFVLSFSFIPALRDLHTSSALGASAGVMAIAIATTVMAPDYRIFPMLNGGIPLWILTAVFVLIDLGLFADSNSGGHLAHLAGAGTGFLFMHQLQRGRDWSTWMTNSWDWMRDLFNPDKPKKGKSRKDELFYKATVPPFKKKGGLSQQRVDEILEKIHHKGFNSLTEEEKEILKKASESGLE